MRIKYAAVTTLTLSALTFTGLAQVSIGGEEVRYLPAEAEGVTAVDVDALRTARADLAERFGSLQVERDLLIQTPKGLLKGHVRTISFDPDSNRLTAEVRINEWHGSRNGLKQIVQGENDTLFGCRFETPAYRWTKVKRKKNAA